jgi:Asp-tRNA(Asn)/Glu-tRNA(Gln) amidotransferase C subunit
MKKKDKIDLLVNHIESCFSFLQGKIEKDAPVIKTLEEKYGQKLAEFEDEEQRIDCAAKQLNLLLGTIEVVLEVDEAERIMHFYIESDEVTPFTEDNPIRKVLIRRRIVSFLRDLIQVAEAYVSIRLVYQFFPGKRDVILDHLTSFFEWCSDIRILDRHEEVITLTRAFIKAVRADMYA